MPVKIEIACRLRFLFVFVALLTSLAVCSRTDARRSLPVELEGGWKLSNELNVPTVRAMSLGAVEATWGAHYQGPVPISVTVLAFQSQATAFEAVQKAKPEPGSITFHRGRYFFTVFSTEADNATLNRFAAALEKSLQW
jgi:hypothetical protein